MLDYFKIRTFPKIRKMLEKNSQSARKYALIPRELGIVETCCKKKVARKEFMIISVKFGDDPCIDF